MKRVFTNYFVMAFIFLFTFAFIASFAFIDTSTLEDSIWLKPALDIIHGKVLFRDTFSGYGMLVPLLQAATMKLFGPFSLVLRLESAFIYALSISLLFLVWIRFITVKNAVAAVLIWLILAPFYTYILLPWSSVYALDFQAAAFLLLVLAFTDNNRWLVFAAGACATLTFLSRQPVGVFLGMASAAYYLLMAFFNKNGKKAELANLIALISGSIACMIPFLIYLWANRALNDWWIQSFLFARQFAITVRGLSVDQIFKSMFMLRFLKDGTYLQNIIWLLIPLSSIYLLLKAFLEYKKEKLITEKARLYLLAGLITGASWLQYYPEVGPSHFFWANTPVIGFFVFALHDIIGLYNKRIARLFSNCQFVPLIAVLVLLSVMYQFRLRNYTEASKTIPSLKGIRLTAYDTLKIDSFYGRLRQNLGPGDTYINLSDDALVTLLDDRFHTVDPLYMQRDFITSKIYPDYYKKAFMYVTSKQPVIVTRTLPYINNYCLLNDVSYPQPEMGIHIPLSRVAGVSATDNVLMLTARRNIKIVSVKQLIKPLDSFNVPDTGKLKLLPAISGEVPLPIAVKYGESAEIPLSTAPIRIVLTFNDRDIRSCVISVTSQPQQK